MTKKLPLIFAPAVLIFERFDMITTSCWIKQKLKRHDPQSPPKSIAAHEHEQAILNELSVRSANQCCHMEKGLTVEAPKHIESGLFEAMCSMASKGVRAARSSLHFSSNPRTLVTFVEASQWLLPNANGYFYPTWRYGKVVVRFDLNKVSTVEPVVCHEYAHAIVRALGGGAGNCPCWLDEGIAQYTTQVAGYNKRKPLEIKTGTDMAYFQNIGRLTSRKHLLYPSATKEYRLLVSLSVSALHHHADRYGHESIKELVGDLASPMKRYERLNLLLETINALLA